MGTKEMAGQIVPLNLIFLPDAVLAGNKRTLKTRLSRNYATVSLAPKSKYRADIRFFGKILGCELIN